MATTMQAYQLPGSGLSINTTTSPSWSNPSYITAIDVVNYASCVPSGGGGATSDHIRAYNFGLDEFDVPAGQVIVGIEVQMHRWYNGGGGICDEEVRLCLNGSMIGDDKSASAYWYSTAGHVITWGSTSDDWGVTLFSEDIYDSSFGVQFQCAGDSTAEARIDSITIRLTYQTAAEPTVTTAAATGVDHESAVGHGNITDLGDGDVDLHGVCWKAGSAPTSYQTADGYTNEGAAAATGIFDSDMTGLSKNTTYYYKAFARNDVGTSYGAAVSFLTSSEDFTYSGNISLTLTPGATTEHGQQTLEYSGEIVLTLTPQSDDLIEYGVEGGISLSLSSSSDIAIDRTPDAHVTISLSVEGFYYLGTYRYDCDSQLSLSATSEYDWETTYYYSGDTTLSFAPEAALAQNYAYYAEAQFSLTLNTSDSFDDVLTGTLKQWTSWRVEVDHNDGTTIDISDRVYSIKIDGDLNDGDERITIMIRNHWDWVEENLSLDPLDEASTLNQDSSGDFDPLLLGRHEVRVYLRYEGDLGWTLRWQGFSISSNCVHVVSMNDTITFKPYGITHLYKADQRLTKWDYRDRTLNSMLPSILLDSGFKGDRGHVIIQDDPAKTVDTFVSEEDSAWDVMQAAVQETGYILASRYADAGTAFNDGSGLSTSEEGYFLTLYDPIRVAGASTWSVSKGYGIGDRVYYSGVVYHCIVANTGQQPPNSTYWEVGVSSATDLVATQRPIDATFDREFSARKIDANLDDFRSLIQVVYHDRETEDGERKSVTVWSDSSRLRHGIPAGDGTKLHVKMRLVEQRGTNIDTESEAYDFAYASLHDLQEPSPDGQVTLPYFYTYIKMHEWYRFIEDDYTIDLGITGYSLTVTADNPIGQTVIKGTINRVIGRKSSILAQDMTQETRWTRRLDFLLGAPEALPRPTGLTVKAVPINSTMSELRVSWDQCNAWWFDHTEIYLSRGTETRYGTDPVTITTKNNAVLGPYPVNETYYVKAMHVPWKSISQSGVSS